MQNGPETRRVGGIHALRQLIEHGIEREERRQEAHEALRVAIREFLGL